MPKLFTLHARERLMERFGVEDTQQAADILCDLNRMVRERKGRLIRRDNDGDIYRVFYHGGHYWVVWRGDIQVIITVLDQDPMASAPRPRRIIEAPRTDRRSKYRANRTGRVREALDLLRESAGGASRLSKAEA